MQYIYVLLLAFVIVIILWKKQNISFVVIYFLSSVVYYLNAFSGQIYEGKLNKLVFTSYPVEKGYYIVLIINLFLILFMVLSEKETKVYCEKKKHAAEESVMRVFMLCVFVLAGYMCFTHDIFARTSYNKGELAQETGALGTYYKYLSSFVFVYMFSLENVKYSLVWKVIATVPIFTTFFFGNRSFLVISLVAVIFNYIYVHCMKEKRKLVDYLLRHKKIVISAGVFFFVVLAVKGVTSALFNGNYDLVYERLSNIEYYKQVFRVSEPNTISKNLNTIIAYKYQVPTSSYKALWAYCLPFVTEFIESEMGVTNFTKAYQKTLYIDDLNNASTHLGEAYANGGYVVVAIVVISYLLLLSLVFSGYKKCSTNISKAACLLIGIDCAFFVQRNSMAFQFSRIRAYIYISIAIYLLIFIVNRKHKIRL